MSTLYRAVCNECHYTGPWRTSEQKAANDALQHQVNHDHVVNIEVKQSIP